MYQILERAAEKQIDNDPIGYIREESFIRQEPKQLLMPYYKKGAGAEDDMGLEFDGDEEYEELKIENYD